MSGSSDYTTTPNLGLYRPNYDMDDGLWGTHLNANADVLDSAVHALQGSTAGGPFLPLTGGTVSGSTTVRYGATANAINMTPAAPETTTGPGQQFQSYLVANNTGGTPGTVYANAALQTGIQGAPNNYLWNLLSTVDYHGTGGNGQHVGIYQQTIRRTVNAGGTANNPPLWGMVVEAIDFTNTDSGQTHNLTGIEIDLTCGNTDSAHMRGGINMILNKANGGDVAPVVDTGIQISANAGSYNSGLRIVAPYNVAAVDLRNATSGGASANAIWLATGANGYVALDSTASLRMYGDGTGGMVLSGAASQPSRITYNSAHSWWSGCWTDGKFYIVDATASANRVVIGYDGSITLSGTIALTGATAVTGTLSVSGAVSGAGFNSLFASPPAIGGTTAAAGSFTTLNASGNAIINGETDLGRGGADVVVGAQGFVPNASTSGFLVLPFCNGTPTGVPANNTKGIAVIYDVATNRLFAYAGGAWKASPAFV